MTKKIAINGYGRIGRCFHRILMGGANEDFEVVAINDLTDAKTLAHLLKYDSVHGVLKGFDIKDDGDNVVVNGKAIPVTSMRDPAELPWAKLGVDYVLEATGVFRSEEDAGKHIKAGAKKVVLSAPARGGNVSTFVMGVNNETYDPGKHNIFSNASCTTNCLAPTAKVLDELAGIEVRADADHPLLHQRPAHPRPAAQGLRRARAAAMSMIPTTTGAARAVGLVLPAPARASSTASPSASRPPTSRWSSWSRRWRRRSLSTRSTRRSRRPPRGRSRGFSTIVTSPS